MAERGEFELSSAKTQRHLCSAGQEAVLAVKSVQYGVRHNAARSVEAMPLALQKHGESSACYDAEVTGYDCVGVILEKG